MSKGHGYSKKQHGYKRSKSGFTRSQTRAQTKTQATLQIWPSTVAQLLSISESNDVFTIGDTEINQVSLVGIIRRTLSSSTSISYSVDDMSGPSMDVKLWVDGEDPSAEEAAILPGTYVKVSGILRTFQGKRSLVAFNVRRLEDMNQITSHMMEVVHAHMRLGASDANWGGDELNSSTGYALSAVNQHSLDGGPAHTDPCSLTNNQNQVLNMVKSCLAREGISLQDLSVKLGYLSVSAIRTSVDFLLKEGHICSTIDEEHFKAIENSG